IWAGKMALASQATAEHTQFKAKGQQIFFTCKRPQLFGLVDEQYIEIALANIIDNASKYSFEKTTTHVSLVRSGSYAHIAVKDNGVGIKTADLSKLFRKFSRLDNSLTARVGGSGLGLYWTHKIIKLHRGRVEVRSRPGRGTTFHLYLPLAR
ncbi:MAG: ATP-binding protein, partial [Candidatus Saccharimonadales bacterium]